MLGSMSDAQKTHWRDFVKPLVHAYNCTKNDVTGFTPYELMFGRQPRLPIDLAFGLPTTSMRLSHSQYVSNLKKHLEESYQIATRNALKNAERNKMRFDKHVVDSTLEVGDQVLVRQVRLRGKHKLADKWEPSVYIVERRAGELPVYTVRPEGKEGSVRTLHRDLLLPCGFLPVTSEMVSNPPKPVPKPRTRQQARDENSNKDGAEDTAETIEDEVPEYWMRIPTVEKSHQEPSGTLTPILNPPVRCPQQFDCPQLSTTVPGSEKLPVEMNPVGQEVGWDSSLTEKMLEEVMNQLTESDKMLEKGELSENQLSGNLPESPAAEGQESDQVGIREETGYQLILRPMLKRLNCLKSQNVQ